MAKPENPASTKGKTRLLASVQAVNGAAFLAAIHVAGFFSFLSHPIHLFVPSLVAVLLLLIPNRLFPSVDPNLLRLTGLLLGTVVLSALFGANPGLRAFGFAIFTFLPLVSLALNPSALILPFARAFGVISVMAMLAWSWMLYAFLGAAIGPWSSWTPAGTGNLYGLMFNMLWPLLVFVSFGCKSKDQSASFRILAALAFLFALLTFSRAAILSACLSGMLLLVRGRYWKTIALLGAAVLIASPYLWPWLTYARLVEFEPSLGRFAIWDAAIAIWRNNMLFGVSPGGAAAALQELSVYHAHSNILNTLLESGLVAAVLLVLLHVWLACLAVKLFLSSAEQACLACAILVWLSSGQVATTITNPEVTVLLAVITATGRLELQRKATHR